MSSKTEKNIKKTIVVLTVLLIFSLCLLAGLQWYNKRIAPSVIPDQKITTGEIEAVACITPRKTNILTVARTTEQTNEEGTPWKSSDSSILRLYRGQNYDDTAFAVSNMFPGDELTKNYLVQVSHKGNVTIHFKANVHPSVNRAGARLEEVLMCRVEVNDQFLYEGLMCDMPTSVEYTTEKAQRATTTEIPYKITVYLDGPSVGNEHMNKGLSADFQWWVIEKSKEDNDDNTSQDDDVNQLSKEDDDETDDLKVKGEWDETEEDLGILVLPMTGDNTNWIIYAVACVGSFLILLLLVRKRKEENHD